MREQMHEVYRNRGERSERPRQLSPEQRESLRRDLLDADEDFKRKKSERRSPGRKDGGGGWNRTNV